MNPTLEIRLLGPLLVLRDGVSCEIASRKQRRLLAELALRSGQPLSREELTLDLWPESDDAHGRDSLRHALWQLRRTLAPAPALQTRGDAILLDPTAWVDLAEFERLAADDDPDALRAALALYRGDLCTEIESPLGEGERERLRQRHRDLGMRLARQELTAGQGRAAVQVMRRVVAQDPYDEGAQRLLLEALAAAGDKAELVRQYQRLIRALRDDLGLEPSAETRACYAQLTASAVPRRPPVTLKPAASSPPPSLIGRGDEYRRLIAGLADAVDAGGGVLQLRGEGGAGKTRLLEELVATAREYGFRVLLGRAVSAGGRLGYQLWVDALRDARDDAAELPAPWPTVLGTLLPGLLPVPAASGEHHAQLERTRLYEGVARLLDAVAAERPLLVALDDLHWADADALQLLHYLAHALRGARVTFITATRPVGREANPALAEVTAHLRTSRLLTEVDLGPLCPAEVAALMEQAAVDRESARALAGRVAELTGGNPLFVLETVRALDEQGVLQRDEHDRLRVAPTALREALADALPPLRLAEGVRATILTRVEILPDKTRHLLSLAAVLGSTFAPELLAAVSGRDELAVIDALEPALGASLLRDTVRDGRSVLAFNHDLVREAIYQQQPPVRRSALHRRIATVLEQRGAPSALLAHHLTAGGERERAVAHWIAAGQAAEAGFAHEEAIRAYEAALAGLPADERDRRLLLLELLGQAHLHRGAARTAAEHYLRALDLLGEHDDPARRAHLQSLLALACGRNYLRWPVARRHAAEAVAVMEAQAPSSGLCEALLGLAYMQYQTAEAEAAIESAERAFALAEQLQLPRHASAALHVLTWSQLFAGQPHAEAETQAVERLAVELGRDEEAANLYNILGLRRRRGGDLRAAGRAFSASLAVARQVGSLRAELLALELLFGTELRLGNGEAALKLAEEALVLNRRLTLEVDEVNINALATSAEVHALRHEEEAALALCAQLVAVPASQDEVGRPFHATGQMLACFTYLLLGRPDLIPVPRLIPRPRCHDCDLLWLFLAGQQVARGADPARGLELARELEAQIARAGAERFTGHVAYIRALAARARAQSDAARHYIDEVVAVSARTGEMELLAMLRRDPDLSAGARPPDS